MVAENGDQESAECYIKRDLGGGKGACWKYSRRGGGEGDREVAELDSDAGSDGSRDAGTDTGGSQVDE